MAFCMQQQAWSYVLLKVNNRLGVLAFLSSRTRLEIWLIEGNKVDNKLLVCSLAFFWGQQQAWHLAFLRATTCLMFWPSDGNNRHRVFAFWWQQQTWWFGLFGGINRFVILAFFQDNNWLAVLVFAGNNNCGVLALGEGGGGGGGGGGSSNCGMALGGGGATTGMQFLVFLRATSGM